MEELLSKQEEGCGIRIFVAQPGTPHAETCIAYCRPGEAAEDDVPVDYGAFTAYFERRSEPYLIDAVVDFQEDRMGGQLTIKAPNARTPSVGPDSPIEDPHKLRPLQRDQPGPRFPRRHGDPCRSR